MPSTNSTPPAGAPLTIPIAVRRRYPDAPLVGTAAVVLNERGQILLVQRGKPPRQGSWGLPGGLLDLGESLRDGARREVREECAVDVAVHDVIGVFEPIYRDAEGRIEYHYVVIDYWATYLSGEAAPGDDAMAVAWVDPAMMEGYDLLPDSRQMVEKGVMRWREVRGMGEQENGEL